MRRFLASLLILIGLALPCAAAVAVDSANCKQATEQYKTSSTTQTLTGITVTSGFTALAVAIQWDTSGTTPTVSSVTWDVAGANQALSQIAAPPGGTPGAPQWYGAVGITPGVNKTITMVTTSPAAVFLNACSFSGADATGGVTTFPGATSGSSVMTVNVTLSTGDVAVATAYGTISAINGLNGTIIYQDNTNGSVNNAGANYVTGSGSVAIGSSVSLGAISAVAVKAAGGGGSAPTPELTMMGVGP